MDKNLRKIYHNIPRNARYLLLVSALTVGLTALLYASCSNEQKPQQHKEQSGLEERVNSKSDSTYSTNDPTIYSPTIVTKADIISSGPDTTKYPLKGFSLFSKDSIYVPMEYPPELAENDVVEAGIFFTVSAKEDKKLPEGYKKPYDPRDIVPLLKFKPDHPRVSSQDSAYYKELLKEALYEGILNPSSRIKTKADSVRVCMSSYFK